MQLPMVKKIVNNANSTYINKFNIYKNIVIRPNSNKNRI